MLNGYLRTILSWFTSFSPLTYCIWPQNLLEVVAKASEHPINSLDFVDEFEREVVLEKFNATASELPFPYKGATIHGLFEHWATHTPDARAISFEVSRMHKIVLVTKSQIPWSANLEQAETMYAVMEDRDPQS